MAALRLVPGRLYRILMHLNISCLAYNVGDELGDSEKLLRNQTSDAGPHVAKSGEINFTDTK